MYMYTRHDVYGGRPVHEINVTAAAERNAILHEFRRDTSGSSSESQKPVFLYAARVVSRRFLDRKS